MDPSNPNNTKVDPEIQKFNFSTTFERDVYDTVKRNKGKLISINSVKNDENSVEIVTSEIQLENKESSVIEFLKQISKIIIKMEQVNK